MTTFDSAALADSYAFYRDNGFVVLRGFADPATVERLRDEVLRQLADPIAPIEFEADLRYPGAPVDRLAAGGHTVRRLLDAYGRGAVFKHWATHPDMAHWLGGVLGAPALMSQVHHNCVMTKHPQYGSLTGWHRDIRYWSFNAPTLVSTWLALGTETADNGGLWFVPGSHLATFESEQFDAQSFFRDDLADNRAWLEKAVSPTLQPGDVVCFDCKTLHAAGRNTHNTVKLSVVHTYHAADCMPQPGTRSASLPEIALPD